MSLTRAVLNLHGMFPEKPLNMGNVAWGFITADLDMNKETFKHTHRCKLHLSSQLSHHSPVLNLRSHWYRGGGAR